MSKPKKLKRPSAKQHAEIVDEIYRRVDELERELLKARDTIKKIEVGRETALDLAVERFDKIKDLKRTCVASAAALNQTYFELRSYQSLLATMVHESAKRQLAGKEAKE